MAWHGVAWHGMAWHGVAWRGVAWHGMAWHAVAWRGMAWPRHRRALRQLAGFWPLLVFWLVGLSVGSFVIVV